jgi:hypothetical protein
LTGGAKATGRRRKIKKKSRKIKKNYSGGAPNFPCISAHNNL